MDNTTSVEIELREQSLSLIEQAKQITIRDQDSYDQAAHLLTNGILPFRKRLKDYFEGLRKPAYAAYQAVLGKFNEQDKPAEEAERAVKMAIAKWDAEQERIRQEAQREAERRERERLEAERIAEAFFAEQAGASEEQIEAIQAAPMIPVVEEVEPTYQKAAGISIPKRWKCVVTDLKALCKAIGKGEVPASYVEPNMTALNARARADQRTMNIPGCVAKEEASVTGRTR